MIVERLEISYDFSVYKSVSHGYASYTAVATTSSCGVPRLTIVILQWGRPN